MNRYNRLIQTGMVVLLIHVLSIITLWGQFAGGQGTAANPWQISRPEHLNNIRDYLGVEHNNKHYILTANIDLGTAPWNEGEGWVPIGSSVANSFQGNFDGRGFRIMNLTIERAATHQGLFGIVANANIKNVKLENVALFGMGNYSGTLIGRANNSLISNSYVTGNISVVGSYSGGFIGFIAAETEVLDCWNNIDFRTTTGYCGGFIGLVEQSTIRNCFSKGSVTTTGANAQSIGGLVGSKFSGLTTNSYSRNTITAPVGARHIGGLVGSNGGMGRFPAVDKCYATGRINAGTVNVGGLLGSNAGMVQNSYWDINTTGLLNSAGGIGRTTAQMTYPYQDQTYNNWDFRDIWMNDEERVINDGYPILHYQGIVLDTPQISVEQREIEGTIYVVINWEAIEGANSYKIYAAANPYSDDWGNPIATTGETEFIEPIAGTDLKFYYVVASAEER